MAQRSLYLTGAASVIAIAVGVYFYLAGGH